MSLFSDIMDKITGNSTVHHENYMGGTNTVNAKDAQGHDVYISQMNGQTIVRTHDHEVIMNGQLGGDAHNNYARPEDRDHRVDLGMAEKLKQVVSNAMKDGSINPKELAQIEQVTSQTAESRPTPVAANHNQNHGHGRE